MSVRLLIVVALFITAMIVLMLALVATDTALSVWSRLAEAPAWMGIAYLALLGTVTAGATWLAWKWLRPSRKATAEKHPEPVSTETLEARVEVAASEGVDVSAALEELRRQRERKRSGEIFLAVFGEVSTGKSALVKALLPNAETVSDVRAGTTAELSHHDWRSPAGDRVVVTDLPGFNFEETPGALDEVRRAHLVVFLVDGDLTQSQGGQLARLRDLNKPVVLAFNKADRFGAEEQKQILQRLVERSGLPPEDIVVIRTGGREQVVRLLSDGQEVREDRERPTDVEPLRRRLQQHLDTSKPLMESLRDSAALLLANDKLEEARSAHRAQQADELVRSYSRRAVVGALAAVAPGSDLVIQGVLATRLVQALCDLYGVSVKEVQVESFLRMAGGKVRKMSALTLAISGNALKAFPGLGTLSGGLVHAVAYGMIFDSLGRAAAETLASRGELRPLPAVQTFEELLSENLESGAGRFAKLVARQSRETGN